MSNAWRAGCDFSLLHSGEIALGDNYFLRSANPSYIEQIEQTVANSFVRGDRRPNVSLGAYWRRTATLNHESEDAVSKNTLIVVFRNGDTEEQVVALTSLWEETMRYESIIFKTARPEIVCVLPEHRGNNLIKHLFDAWHYECGIRGYLVQTVMGIDNYYRQFGYEYAFDCMETCKTWISGIPSLPETEQEPLTVREASLDDTETLLEIAKTEYADLSVVTVLPRDWLTKQIQIHHDSNANPSPALTRRIICFIDPSNAIVGFAVLSTRSPPNCIPVMLASVDCSRNIQPLVPSMIRNIVKFFKDQVPAEEFEKKTYIEYFMGLRSPFIKALPSDAVSRGQKLGSEGTKYVRVPNLAVFITTLIPALNTRLENSPGWSRYSGRVKVSNYSTTFPGFEMHIDAGKIVKVEEFVKRDQNPDDELARFPHRTFLQVLFGRRSIEELNYVFPDVTMSDQTLQLLNTLFPKTATLSYHYP